MQPKTNEAVKRIQSRESRRDMQVKKFFQDNKGGFIVWGVFGGLLAFAFIRKHGLALAYFKVAPYMWLALAVTLSIHAQDRLDDYMRARNFNVFYNSVLFSFARGTVFILLLSGQLYVYYVLAPDDHLLAALLGIPVEAVQPCRSTLSPETEQLARAFFRLREIDSFECE